jgi:hypothetical protein
MIWYICKQCGKKQRRPEEQAGSLVFCACGKSNRVPWESEPGAAEEELPPARLPDPSPAAESRSGGSRMPSRWELDEPSPRRTTGFCFNHEHTAAKDVCGNCGVAFCEGCLVKVQEKTLCGPCKNFQVRSLSRPARPSVFGILSLVFGLVGGPVAACLPLSSLGESMNPSPVMLALTIVGILLPAVALVLGIKSLREMEGNARVGGRSVAVMGVVAGVIGVIWCVTVIVLVAMRMSGG